MKGKIRRLAAAAVSAALLCSGMPAFAEEVTNVASGITPTQSFSSTSTGNLATLTDGIKGDGTNSTSWFIRADYHASQSPALIFDLGVETKVSSFVVTGSTKYAKDTSATGDYALAVNYDISYSNNGSDWKTAAEVRGNTNYENVTEIPDITARYWKIFVIFETSSTNERVRVCEIEIYGIPGEKVEVAEVPVVGMTEETAQLEEGESVIVSAEASCESSEVTSVEFYDGTTKLADGVLSGGVWTAELSGLDAGEHLITAKAATEAGGVGESDSMRVRVHSDSYANIALGKKATAYHGSTADSYPEALVDGITDNGNGIYKWTANAMNANGAWAEIDLDSGFDNEFLIKSITIRSAYSDTSSTDILTDFTLFYYDGSEWIEAETVTGAGNVHTFSFDVAVPATKVKLLSNMTKAFRVRELEVQGKLYRIPEVTVVSPENVYKDTVEIKVSAVDMGAGIADTEVLLNGQAVDAEIVKNGSEYTVTVTGLSAGENSIVVRAYDQNGRYGESEKVTVNYYSSDDFITQLAECTTAAELGALVQESRELLNLGEGDYTDLDTYGDIYAKILADKDSIKTAEDFIKMFKAEYAIIELNSAAAKDIIDIIRASLTSVSLDEYDELSDEVQEDVSVQLAAAEITDAQQLQELLGVQIALQSIKNTAWTNIETVLEKYNDRLDLDDYTTYTGLSSAKRNVADKYIASKRNSDGMNSLDGFDSIFSQAVKEGRNYTASSSGGGGGSSTVTITGQTTQSSPIAEELNPYDDVDKSNSSWAAILYLTEKGVMQGDGDRTFAPERALKREEFARILVDGFFEVDQSAQTTFVDVKESDWFYSYVATGQQMELIAGMEQYWFGSGEYVTREQMAVLCYRAALKAGKSFAAEGEGAVPSDEELISSWAYYPIKLLRQNGVFSGETLRPTDAATRAEAAQLLYEIMLMEE